MISGELTKEKIKLRDTDMALLEQMPPKFSFLLQNAEKSYVDLAKAINMKVGTVRSRLHRARTMLLKLRGPEGDESA